jgi:sentrin-specific protease 1
LDNSKSKNENDSVSILTKKLDSVKIFGHISEEKKTKIYYFNTKVVVQKNVVQKKLVQSKMLLQEDLVQKKRPTRTRNTKSQKKVNTVQQLLEHYGEDNQHLQNAKHLLKIGLNAYEVEKIIEIFKLLVNDDIIKLNNNTITHDKGNWPKNEFMIESIQRLQTDGWLNDDIIDAYYRSLQNRYYRQSLFFPVHYLIYLYLYTENYNFDLVLDTYHKTEEHIDQLKNVFEMDKIFFPVHKDGNHYSLIVIYVQQKRINYYDSLSTRDAGSYGEDMMENIILMWLTDVADKFKISEFNSADWTKETTDKKTVPQQVGGCDCGIFCIMFTDYLANNLPLADNVIQKYVPYFRIVIAITYLNQKLVY